MFDFKHSILLLNILNKFGEGTKLNVESKQSLIKKMYQAIEQIKTIETIEQGCEKCKYYNNGICKYFKKQVPNNTETFSKKDGCKYYENK